MDKKVLKWNLIFQYGYVFTNIINSIILLPLYVKFIDTTVLGFWLATGNVLAWLTMADPGIGDILQQKIAELNGEGDFFEIEKTIGSGLISSLFVFIISLIAGFVFYLFLGIILNDNIDQYSDFKLAFIISIFATSITLVAFGVAGINQGLHNSKTVAKSYILSNLLFLITNIFLLYMKYGVMSIAIANLVRAVFLTFYNFTGILKETRRGNLLIVFKINHFKSFIKIFSYTSISKIVMAISNNIDLVLLAKHIKPSMITSFEINRRPIKMTQTLIGRYSVALMPIISHAKGKGDFELVKTLINNRFKIYAHIVLLASFLFMLSMKDLIKIWVGEEQYAGNIVLILLVLNFFFATLGYFVSNMAFALGDIKNNSKIWIVGSVLLTFFSFIGVYYGGMIGLLSCSLITVFVFDFFIFLYSFIKKGFMGKVLLINIFKVWTFLLPFSFLIYYLLSFLKVYLENRNMFFLNLIAVNASFCMLFFTFVYFIDLDFKNATKKLFIILKRS